MLTHSLFKCESLLEIYNDAHTFGIISSNSVAASNSKLAISWLEATFPELQNQETEGDSLSLLRAHAHAVFDASLVLQVYSCYKLDSCKLYHQYIKNFLLTVCSASYISSGQYVPSATLST